MRSVDFHTQAADTHNKLNSGDAERLLKAAYDIMAPKGMPMITSCSLPGIQFCLPTGRGVHSIHKG